MREKARVVSCQQRIGLLVLGLLLGLALPAHAQKATTNGNRQASNEEPVLTLAALYRKNIEGPYLEGICDALTEHPHGSRMAAIEVPYGNEDTAFDKQRHRPAGWKRRQSLSCYSVAGAIWIV